MGNIIFKEKKGSMSEYSNIINKMVWSYSKLSMYEQCKYAFYLKYIVNDNKQYLDEGNYYAESGSFVHDTLAKVYNNEISSDEAIAYFINNYDNNIFHETYKNAMDSTFEKCSDYFTEKKFEWCSKYEIIDVEKKVNFIIDGYRFIGYIDLLLNDKKNNKIILVDHKSSKYPFKKNGELSKGSKEIFEKYKRQMYLYAYAVNDVYGKFPDKIVWNHFKDGGRLAEIPFSKRDYNKSLKWIVDTIHDIEKEEDWPDKKDIFYCNNLCGFRSSCEYNL